MATTTSFEVQYDLIDTSATTDGTYTATYEDAWADIDQLATGVTAPTEAATWEHNYFVLDGTMTGLTTDPTYGFLSKLSGADGTFTDAMTITDTFTQNHTSAGINFLFSGWYPGKITITWYDLGGNRIAQETFYPDALGYFAASQVSNYGKVEITFAQVNPYSRVRVLRIQHGKMYTWGEEEIKTAKSTEEVDMLSDTIPIGKLTFELHDGGDEFNLGNIKGLHNVLQKGQEARAYEYIDGTRLFLGKWYFNANTSSGNTTSITMQDSLCLLDATDYTGGTVYDGTTYAGDVIDDIMETCGITGYEVDEDTAGTRLYGALKPMTCRKALREVLFATDSIIQASGLEDIVIRKRSKEVASTIHRNRKFSTSMTKNEYITDVTVQYSEYVPAEDAEQISEAEYDGGTVTIRFDSPVVPGSITATASAGTATITEQHAFYVTVTLSSACTLTLTGRKYTENKLAATAAIEEIEAGSVRKAKSFTGTLMNYRMAKRKAAAALEYYQLRNSITVECIGTADDHCGDWIEVENPEPEYSNLVAGAEKVETDLTGGFTKKISSRGYYDVQKETNYAGVYGPQAGADPIAELAYTYSAGGTAGLDVLI